MGELFKKHPEIIGLLVIGVIVLAYMKSRGSNVPAPVDAGGDSGVQFTGGGVQAVPVDPNAAAIAEAQIGANTANFTSLSQLLLGMNEAAFSRDVQTQQTSAALAASLASTEAARQVAVGQTAAQVTEAGISANEQLNAANVTSQMAANAQAANLAAINLENQRQLEINATQRDIARVDAKSHFWSNLFGGAEGVVAALFA